MKVGPYWPILAFLSFLLFSIFRLFLPESENCMSDRAKELEEAAASIDAASLDTARKGIVTGCQELIYWLELLSRRLEKVPPEKEHKFARAFSLIMLGHLPTRPETCPFCVQYGQSRSCRGCGYAATHGRCDSDQSSFSLFIEAFSELGRVIYQDTGGLNCHPDDARLRLEHCIRSSRLLAADMMEDIDSSSAERLMERKARYLGQMIDLLPKELFGPEIMESWRRVHEMLRNYW